MPALQHNWIDRAVGVVAPRWALNRTRARVASDLIKRHYEAAATGRRTDNWNRSSGDATAIMTATTLSRLREVARDLVRNNGYAESAVTTICDHVVGWGISAKARKEKGQEKSPSMDAWKAWAETTACDADGRNDFYGLQTIVMSTVVESGEVLVRRRIRRPEDGFAIPLQLQVLEPDHLDTAKTETTPTGRIVQGVEFDLVGRRVAYWLFPAHPGASLSSAGSSLLSISRRVPATEVLHVFRSKRAGQVRAPSWFAPIILMLKDFDEFADATLMKQKIAACLAVITSDVDGSGAPLGTADDTSSPGIDTIEPGAIIHAPAGRNIEVVSPPSTGDYKDFCGVTLRAIATGLGVSYEDLTGDYTGMPFSAARMSRLRHWARVQGWRWRMLIPQFCDPAYVWFREIATIAGVPVPAAVQWTAPPPPLIDPANEGLAYQRLVRNGFQSLYDALRELGYDPEEVLEEIAEGNARLDELGLKLDSDPRLMTQAGQMQSAIASNNNNAPPADPATKEDNA